jgi:RNA polymerase primary sigma factor
MANRPMTIEQVIYIQKIIAMEPISLATPVGDEGDSEIGDFIESDKPTAEELCLKAEVHRQLEKYIDQLDPRESVCIKKYYGFDDGSPNTLEQIGRMYGVTRERIRQIIAKSTRRLSMMLKRSGLSAEDF